MTTEEIQDGVRTRLHGGPIGPFQAEPEQREVGEWHDAERAYKPILKQLTVSLGVLFVILCEWVLWELLVMINEAVAPEMRVSLTLIAWVGFNALFGVVWWQTRSRR